MEIQKEKHGIFYNQNVDIFTLSNDNNMTVKISQLGGIITNMLVPDNQGVIADVVTGYDSIKDYSQPNHFFGTLIGRVANRIEGAKYTLNNQTYHLNANVYDGRHTVHGGYLGYNLRIWQVADYSKNDTSVSLNLSMWDQDGEQGFGGNVKVNAIYTLTNDNSLKLEMIATTDLDTPISFTSHSYFNLNGHDSDVIDNHSLQLHSSQILAQKEDRIPSGELINIENTDLDFRKLTNLKQSREAHIVDGINTSFVINNHSNDNNDNKSNDQNEIVEMAILSTDKRTLTVSSNEKTLHFYNGHNLNNVVGKNGTIYKRFCSVCLEPKGYVNSINIPTFPQNILKPNDVYNHTIIYSFS